MAIKYLAFVLFFSLTVIYPVHVNFDTSGDLGSIPSKNGTKTNETMFFTTASDEWRTLQYTQKPRRITWPMDIEVSTDYLWMYVIFSYLFSVVAMYMIIRETKRIIRIRQTYLGSHSSVTDRTIRLSGIPRHLRSEGKITDTIEHLEIGKVESVMLCREWKELDDLIIQRWKILRKLEEAWTVHLGYKRTEHTLESLSRSRQQENDDHEDEDERLGLLASRTAARAHVTTYAHDRPTTRMWFGFLNLQSRKIDAIDYYEEKLRQLDEQIKEARETKYLPTPFAFVTLDSTAACVSNLTARVAIYLLILPLANGRTGDFGSRAHAANG